MIISPTVFSKTRMVCSARGGPESAPGIEGWLAAAGLSSREFHPHASAVQHTHDRPRRYLERTSRSNRLTKSWTVFRFGHFLIIRILIQLVQVFQTGAGIEQDDPFLGMDPVKSQKLFKRHQGGSSLRSGENALHPAELTLGGLDIGIRDRHGNPVAHVQILED